MFERLLTLLKNCYEIASILVWLLLLDSREIDFTSLSNIVVIAQDLSKSLSDVLEFLLVHSKFSMYLRKY